MLRVFSHDHKVIGLQYAITSMVFLLIGFVLMLMMRWQLAYPGAPLPLAGTMTPEFYNQLGAMHGTIMIFLGVVPLAVGGFGNYLIPLQIGAPDVAFPRLNMLSYWVYAAAGTVMVASFFVPGGAANNGWTSYPPLSVISDAGGQTLWLVGIILLVTSSLLQSVNTIVTIMQMRARGLGFMRLPFFIWAQLVTAFLLLLAFPPLGSASVMQLMDRVAGTSFFMPSGLVVGNRELAYAGGGNPLLWQHLFWFLAHPEVYVLILPAMGIVAEVLAANIRKPLWGYRLMVYSAMFLGFMSMLVWAHHMFLTGMGTTMSAFFQTTTMIVSIPSVVILTSFFVSLYGGSIRFTTPALFALAFLPMFGIGGLTGLPLGLAAADIHLHDTYYVVGHFHYIVAPGTLFALFAGVYHWFPKVTGRQMNDTWGRVHFWGSLVCMNLVFMPMFLQGLAGLNRRLYDGGITYEHGRALQHWNVVQGWSAWALGLFQIVFIVNLFVSWRRGRRAGANPWEATTLEWSDGPVCVVRGPYEYSVPGEKRDYSPQAEPEPEPEPKEPLEPQEPRAWEPRRDTGTTSITLGVWLFIASEVMLFGGLFSAYVLLRSGAMDWPAGSSISSVPAGSLNTLVLLLSSAAVVLATRAAAREDVRRSRTRLWAAVGLGLVFLGVRAWEYSTKLQHGLYPETSTFLAVYYLLTGVHAAHVVGGLLANAHFAFWGPAGGSLARFASRVRAAGLYWHFVDVVWIVIFVLLYLV